MRKNKNSKSQTKLSADQVKEITDFIKERKEAGIEPAQIRKEVFKKFNIDTTQWELNWEPNAKKVKGNGQNTRVKDEHALTPTSNQNRRNEPVSFKYEFNESEINERGNILAQQNDLG